MGQGTNRVVYVGIVTAILLSAGCVTFEAGNEPGGPNSTDPKMEETKASQLRDPEGQLRSSMVGETVHMAGFVRPADLDQGLQQAYREDYENLTEAIRHELPSITIWSIGLFLEEDFVAHIDQPAEMIREHGAAVALPNFTEPKDRSHYISFQGEVLDLANLTDQIDRSSPIPLVVADDYELLQPQTVDLQTLHQDFDAITDEQIATHLGTRSFAMGTTLKHADEAASDGGSSVQQLPFDVGVYDAFNATEETGSVESYHLPVVTLNLGKGQELLGDQAHVEGFLVSEEQLSEEAQQRVPELPAMAERWANLSQAGEAYKEETRKAIDEPHLSHMIEESLAAADRQNRIPAYFLAYKIEKTDPIGFYPLQSLEPQPFPEDRLLLHLETEGYLTGTTAETVCRAADEDCELPYDVGAYHLFNVTFTEDHPPVPTFTQIPVVFPAKEISFPLNAAAGVPVSVDGAWVTESIARERIHATVENNTDDDSPARELLTGLRGPAADRLRTAEGYLYAFDLQPIPPIHRPPLPVLAWNETEQGDSVVQWTPCVDEDFDRYEIHQAHHRMARPSEETLAATIPDCQTTRFEPADLEDEGRYVRVWVFDRDDLRSPSNAVFAGDGTTRSEYRASQPFVELESLTRCPEAPADCLDVTWRANPTDRFERFEVERTTNTTDWSLTSTIDDEDQRRERDDGLTCGTEYTYRIKLYDGGDVLTTATSSKTPFRPGGCASGEPSVTLEGVDRCGSDPSGCLRVSWTADTTEEFDSFEVYRTNEDTDWSHVETLTNRAERSYRDGGLDCGTEYTYEVRLHDGGETITTDTLTGSTGEPPSCY